MSEKAGKTETANDKPKPFAEPINWFAENLTQPFVEAITTKPINALINAGDGLAATTNQISSEVIGKQLVKEHTAKKAPTHHSDSSLLSPEGIAQTIATGLADAVVFSVAAKAGEIALMPLARRLPLASSLSNTFVKHWVQPGTRVVGVSAYEGLRDTNKGETHWGNFFGGAASFAGFEIFNPMTKHLNGMKFLAARASIGGLSSGIGSSLSTGISEKRLLSPEELAKGVLLGSVVNSAMSLPEIVSKARIGRISSKTNTESLSKPSDHKDARIVDVPLLKISDNNLQHLSGFAKQDIDLLVPAKPIKDNYRDYADYLASGVAQTTEKFHVRKIKGEATELYYPASLESEVGKLRLLKFLNENPDLIEPAKLENPKYKKLADLVQQAKEVKEDPNYWFAWPEDLLALYNELPCKSLVKKIVVSQNEHRDAAWTYQQTGKLTFGEAKDGGIWLWSPVKGPNLRKTFFHEYAHLLKETGGPYNQLFDDAVHLLRATNPTNNALKDDLEEIYCTVLGERILAPRPHQLTDNMVQQPLLELIAAREIGEKLKTVPMKFRTEGQNMTQSKLNEIEDLCLTEAQKQLVSALESNHVTAQPLAIKLLGYLGDSSHLPLLRNLLDRASAHKDETQAALARLSKQMNKN